jgi:hypothetical protein
VPNLKRLLRSGLVSVLLLCFGIVLGQPSFTETAAWGLDLKAGAADNFGGGLEVDDAGNAYILYGTYRSTYTAIVLARVSAFGSLSYLKVSKFPNATPIGVVVDSSHNAYTLVTFQNVSGDADWLVSKYDSHGTLQWTKVVSGLAGLDDFAMSIGLDANSNVCVAGEMRDLPKSPDLKMVSFDPTGASILTQEDPTLDPRCVQFQGGRYFVEGSDNGPATAPTTKWGAYDATTGIAIAGGTLANGVDPITNDRLFYRFYMKGRSDVTWLVGLSTIDSGVTDTFTYHVQQFDSLGNVVWTSTDLPGTIFDLAGGNGLPAYVARTADGVDDVTGTLQALNDTGVALWSQPLENFAKLRADATGCYALIAEYNVSQTPPQILRFDVSGNQVWSAVFFPGFADGNQTFDGFKDVNGNLWAYGSILSGNTGGTPYFGVRLRRYAPGIVLNTISGPSTLTGGSVGTVTLSLNGAAPTGGVTVFMAASTNVTFSNNKPSIAIKIPAGATSVDVPIQTAVVGSPQIVQIFAREAGVSRTWNITLN